MSSSHAWFCGSLAMQLIVSSAYVASDHGLQVRTGGKREFAMPQRTVRARADLGHGTPVPDSLIALISGLRTIGGSFSEDPRLFIWVFSRQHDRRVERIEQYGKIAVAPLAGCINDTHSTATVANGRPVLMGALCGWVLEGIVYYEASDSAGEIDPFWAGHIDPTANARALHAAARAWKVVIREGTYSFL